jgi:hypothetical protein
MCSWTKRDATICRPTIMNGTEINTPDYQPSKRRNFERMQELSSGNSRNTLKYTHYRNAVFVSVVFHLAFPKIRTSYPFQVRKTIVPAPSVTRHKHRRGRRPHGYHLLSYVCAARCNVLTGSARWRDIRHPSADRGSAPTAVSAWCAPVNR